VSARHSEAPATSQDPHPTHLDALAVRRTLREAGLRARHGLSQNFLADVDVLEDILAEAEPAPGRRVLEIGPGLGILTGGLLGVGAAVTAIELDRGLSAFIRSRQTAAIEVAATAGPAAPGALTLIEADALDLDLTGLVPAPYDVVANLPYHITSPILHRLLGDEPRPRRLVLMVQREVAERIAAAPGGLSYLSVFVQYHAEVRIARLVPPEAFEPEPAVESAILVLEPRQTEGALADPDDQDQLWRLVQAAFRERRKMLHNVLSRQLPIAPQRLAAALATAGIAPDRRPQTVSVGEWLALRTALGPIGPDQRGRSRSSAGTAEPE
jgi:16S rRNA (adenine1518-N6/adenine1519-N6)-dimethyltransferase